jgi:gliding motility-associated-like protein
MKIKLLFLAVACVVFSGKIFSQQTYTPQQWENAKRNGTIDGKAKYSFRRSDDTTTTHYKLASNYPLPQPASSSCACWQVRDTSWQICQFDGSGGSGGPGIGPEYRNDDWTTPLINLPFTFCLYGTQWTTCFINNNGNVSFGAPYSTYTATGFPNNTFTMVAPFWGDVDTRSPLSGLVYYKITPTHMIVQWDSVGYFGIHGDLLNTFQLIMTNGSDPIVPGANVSFCYKDMQWTTGDASGGVNGFGGSNTVVGANEGNGIDYIQFGAFNAPGGVYNGPANGGSGIDWLDNQSFIFDACASNNNVPPTVSGLNICDTLQICLGDTLNLNVQFFSPEVGQITTITTSVTSGYTVVSNTPGNTAQLISYFVGTTTGYNTITITATDNGTPPASTIIPIVIQVNTPPVTTISNDTTVCSGPVSLFATGGGSYLWSPNASLSCDTCANTTANPNVTTTYIVEIDNGCVVHDTVTVTIQNAFATAGPDTTICAGSLVHLNATGGVTYVWTPTTGLSNPNIANPTATPLTTTTYTVTVTDAIGCVGTQTVTINVNPSPISIFTFSPSIIFVDSTYTFTDQSTGGPISWLWYFGDGNTSTLQNPTHVYTAAGIYHVCLVTTSATTCTDSVCTDVLVEPHKIEAPNVFTPNGDNNNDLLVFKNLEYFPGCHLVIYDRWGVLVYDNGNYLNDWNGKDQRNGKDCVDGVYYYILSGPKLDKSLAGFVELIRGGK